MKEDKTIFCQLSITYDDFRPLYSLWEAKRGSFEPNYST